MKYRESHRLCDGNKVTSIKFGNFASNYLHDRSLLMSQQKALAHVEQNKNLNNWAGKLLTYVQTERLSLGFQKHLKNKINGTKLNMHY